MAVISWSNPARAAFGETWLANILEYHFVVAVSISLYCGGEVTAICGGEIVGAALRVPPRVSPHNVKETENVITPSVSLSQRRWPRSATLQSQFDLAVIVRLHWNLFLFSNHAHLSLFRVRDHES